MKREPTPGSTAFAPRVASPRYRLDRDLILPPETQVQLEECLASLRHHHTIYLEWDFASVDPVGRATVLNFHGQPGTGKTLAAEALAGTLGLGYLALGIAEVESKFLGETAHNIAIAFETAERESALLLFDEADTLLGKRLSVVTQGVDNEVNAMRTTLMLKLQEHAGVVVFATNLPKSYDAAFRSRIGYHVHFALPGASERKRLWNRMLVPRIPLADTRDSLVDAATAASEGLSGRDIRTCMRLALPKALLAVEGDATRARLTVEHIEGAIAAVRNAQQQVGSSASGAFDLEAARRAFKDAVPQPTQGEE